MEYTELNTYLQYLNSEVENLKTSIEYKEKYMMNESPKSPELLRKTKEKLKDLIEELDAYTKYFERLSSY